MRPSDYTPINQKRILYKYPRWWIVILLLAVALGIIGLVLGAVSIHKQLTGFSTPSLTVNRLTVGETFPLAKKRTRVDGDDSTMALTVEGSTMIQGNLVLSGGTLKMDIPVGTTLTTSKTVSGYYHRINTYSWSVTKSGLQPNVTISSGQCAVVGYNVNGARHLETQMDEYGMTGTITVTNGGEVSTQNLHITDTLEQNCGGGAGFVPIAGPFLVDISIKPILAAGETHVYPYTIVVGPGPLSPSCSYRNFVNVTITNHAGWQPGNNNCPGPDLCSFGPQAREPLTFPSAPTVVEIHESAKITDFAECPLGFSCTNMPTGDVFIPDTEGVCEFNAGMFACTIYREICNTFVECDTWVTVSDFIRLMSVNETTPFVTESNMVSLDVYSGACQGTGCTLTIGYWKTHNGYRGHNADRVTPLLPIDLGCPSGQHPPYTKGVTVTNALQSTAILQFNGLLGGGKNGLNKLAAQLLAAKLNIANGATNSIAGTISSADGYLCSYGFNAGSWNSLNKNVQQAINNVQGVLDNYNNGQAGTPHCE